ncbi:alpha-hydroxy acid oxidase [Caballeronia mineralivorans]|jgi:(S)-mandelate dehydrogenase|uniref:alpha-hydroxy acid oxidase n=1 Tax=Caballeronia mineralivorans TaxID=2010198 RepID=UPI0023EF708A|nr:alpha-hydroxy acid oxidase [Caballeronia mineralivorans]MDB5788041.1 2-hydroxy-acid oxidase [Caballeronia mineralivorans]MDB6043209.1 2-hydroxy-acid oxidase [Gammaproteobacteria bacterium]
MPWKRRAFSTGGLTRALNIADLRELARRRVPGFIFEYVEGGSEDEASLRCNRTSFEALRLIPQTLVDTSNRHQRVEILGRPAAAPLIIGPTGLNGMLHSDGDIGLARAAAKLGIPYTLSTMSTTRLEDVARQAGGRLWMQLYVMKDRAVAEDIMRRAAAAGYEALVFTTDANVFGSREWDRRSYRQPGKPTLRSKLDTLRHPGWLIDVLGRNGIPRFRNFETFLPPGAASAVGGSTIIPKLFDATITWDDLTWIRRLWPRKLLIKGVLSVADAERAGALGCDGIVLTNHGGRQLDSCIAPIDVLPEIAAAVGKRLSVIIDGGFRRGTDVVKALALGADAVMTGRATLYGLAADGERGVERALEILTTETDRVLGQLGCNSVADLGPHLVRRC